MMPRYTGHVLVGDVLVTREGPWYATAAIRLGAAIAGLPAACNHVIVAHHQDERGTMWGIEGRPGGVGWRDLSGPLAGKLTNANNQQPKTDDQRFLIATAVEALMATPYDWKSISKHVRQALRFWGQVPIKEWGEDTAPGHVVCSSLADWAYEQAGLPSPGGYMQTRMTSPGHWDKFIMNEEWEDKT